MNISMDNLKPPLKSQGTRMDGSLQVELKPSMKEIKLIQRHPLVSLSQASKASEDLSLTSCQGSLDRKEQGNLIGE